MYILGYTCHAPQILNCIILSHLFSIAKHLACAVLKYNINITICNIEILLNLKFELSNICNSINEN